MAVCGEVVKRLQQQGSGWNVEVNYAVWVCMSIYVCKKAYMQYLHILHAHEFIHTYIHTHTPAHITCTCVHTYIHTHSIGTNSHVGRRFARRGAEELEALEPRAEDHCEYACIHIYTRVNIHTYIHHTCIHAYMYICLCILVQVCGFLLRRKNVENSQCCCWRGVIGGQ